MSLSLSTIKLISLILLITQSTSLVLCMRQSRLTEGPQYLSSSAVILAEVIKLIICFAVVGWNVYQKGDHLHHSQPQHLQRRFTSWLATLFQPADIIKLSLVGALYAVQNNLLYLALTHLPPAIYQVTYQLKVLTTAGFSVVLLRRRLSRVQWGSLIMLAVGVAIVQLTMEGASLAQQEDELEDEQSLTGPLIGFVAVAIAACTSGFAGVLFELVLKGAATSLWERNIQLAFFGLVFSLGYQLFSGSEGGDFFVGFNGLVWVIILLQALGGLLIAMVVSYMDNIVKAFATSFSIILSSIISILLGDLQLAPMFYLGAAIVILATYLYSEYKPPPEDLLPK